MATSADSFLGSLFQMKITSGADDVTNLLSTPISLTQQKMFQQHQQQQQQQNNRLQIANTPSTPSTSRLSSTASTLSATSNDTVTTSFSTSIDLRNAASRKFEEQIKYLDKQAKDLQMQLNSSSNKVQDVSSLGSMSTATLTPMLPTTSPPPLPQQLVSLFDSKPAIRSAADIKDEENYYEKMKERLNMQIEETEKLKQNLIKSREKSAPPKVGFSMERTTSVPNLFEIKPTETSSPLSSTSNKDLSYKSEEIMILKKQLKEANLMIDELKLNFRKNLVDLQTKLQDCIEDKDRLQSKKEKRIKDLVNENVALKEELEDIRTNSTNSVKNEKLNTDMAKNVSIFETAFKKLVEVIHLEEKKREKSYFTDSDKKNDDPECVFKAIQKCLDDYHGEIKHIKSTIKENENTIEEKLKAVKDKETACEEEYLKKHKALKEDFEKRLSEQKSQFDLRLEEMNTLKTNLFNLKSKYESDLNSRDLTIAELKLKTEDQINNLNLIIENSKIQNEQLKHEIELNKKNELNIMQKYQEQLNTNNFYLKENENLKNNIQLLQNSFDAYKLESKNYEGVIDETNQQISNLKRERNELLAQIENLNKRLENEKLDNNLYLAEIKKLKDEKQLTGIVLAKFRKMDENFSDLMQDQEKLQNLLDYKTKELNETGRLKESIENNLKMNEDRIRALNEEKMSLELKYKEQSLKLSSLQLEVDNYSTLMNQTSKNSALLKDEKETLNRILHDNAIKLKDIKTEYDNVVSKLEIKEKLFNDLQIDFDVTSKKLEQIQTLNDALIKDKEDLLKELKESRFEVNNLQMNNKLLNKKLSQTTTDKDAQIFQMQQSLALLEREINLLKQVEKLHKNHEDSKFSEVANSIQSKLTQKRQKIELLKTKTISLEANLESIKKEKSDLQEDKSHLESQLITYQSKNEALQQELKNTEYNLQETRKKISRYEMALEKAAIKYSNLQIINETLEKENNKCKQLVEQYSSNQPQQQHQHRNHQQNQKQQQIYAFLQQQQQQNLQNNNNNNNLQLQPVKDSSEQNLRFTNELKNILHEMKFVLFKCNPAVQQQQQQVPALRQQNGKENLLDSVDEKSVNDESQASLQETTRQLCNRLESKLNQLNQMGINLKKESTEMSDDEDLINKQQIINNKEEEEDEYNSDDIVIVNDTESSSVKNNNNNNNNNNEEEELEDIAVVETNNINDDENEKQKNHSDHNDDDYDEQNSSDDHKSEKVIKFQDDLMVNNEIALIEKNDENAGALVAVTQQERDMDSGFDSRPESSQEVLKRKIYKQAININKVAFNTPKEKRIHESVTKVFGNDDPPPGFGLIYPKYYYLEQKRPQPMSPLKVWRGFNGNIYFEPIQYNHLQSPENLTTTTTTIIDQQQQVLYSHRQLAITAAATAIADKKLSRARTEGDIRVNKLTTAHRNTTSRKSKVVHNNNSSRNSKHRATTTAIPNSGRDIEQPQQQQQQHQHQHNDNDDNDSNDEEFIFITQPQENHIHHHPPTEFHRNFNSSSSFIQQNQLHIKQMSQHNYPHTHQSYSEQLHTPKIHTFIRTTTNKAPNSPRKKEIILPNPPVNKSKGPVKGLAYKEVKQRIIDKSHSNALAYYTSNLDEAYLEQLNQREDVPVAAAAAYYDSTMQTNQNQMNLDNNTHQSSTGTKKRLDYKNMMKKIRKGITSTTKDQQQPIQHHNHQQQQQHQHDPLAPPQTAPTKLPRSDRTTSAYISYTRSNRFNQLNNDLVLGSINSSTNDFNGMVSENNNDLLIKGGKITIDVLINESSTLYSPHRYTSNSRNNPVLLADKSILSSSKSSFINNNTTAHDTVDDNSTIHTYNTLKHAAVVNQQQQQQRLKSSNTSLYYNNKSLRSSNNNTIFGLTGRRINPTPELITDHHSHHQHQHFLHYSHSNLN